MPNKLTRADEETIALLNSVIVEYYSDLNALGVRFNVLMAAAPRNDQGEVTGPALKLHSYQCSALVGPIPYKWRVMGMADVEITIDADAWAEMEDEQKKALLDHEVHHVVISRDANGAVISDHCGRPKIKMRLHDRQMGFFDAVAARHGANSMEVVQATQFFKEAGQTYFPFATILGDSSGPKRRTKRLKA